MSWAEEDWTVGLSGKVLQKVKELQVHLERLSRENKQKQLLLDNIQTSLEKQTAKFNEARVELQSSHRELQRVQEEAKAAITSKERLSQDLQSKQAQVCSLEGQLDTARSLSNKLTQEVKRLEAELEKLQNSSRAAETTLFSTPCWSSSSWELSGSRKEERHGNREEGKTQGLHVRRLQFSDKPTGSLPREQPRGAHHLQTPDVFSTPSAAFPWERDDAKPKTRRPSPVSPKTPNSDALSQSQLEPDLSVKINHPNDSEPDSFMSELRCRLTDMEEELRIKVQRLNTIQNEVAQNKKELAAKEINIQRLRDELSLAHTCMSQEGERASTAEQKAKQLQEELKCQRQNAESSRVQHHQRTKELEKQHQRDLQEFQKERLFLERQHQQEINKLNQDLAQARAQHNALQAQLDKESVQKQALMKEVETLKEKLKWTEGQVQQSQKKEAQTQSKMTEALREAEALTVSLKQSQKKERALEEDGKRLTEERDNALGLLRDLQEQKAAISALQPSLKSCPPAHSLSQTSVSNASQPLHQSQKLNPTNSTKQKREEVDSRGEIKVPFPTDREPGEGIDSEHISDNLSVQSERQECHLPTKSEEILETDGIQTFAERTHIRSSKQAMPSADLRVENAALCSELRDVREELQKRLDDLEAQRRAEMEAKTRLKQLSRKNANQITEKEEQYKECETQLEKERSEVSRLKKALAELETEIMRETQEKCVKKNEENNTVLQEKEDEMIEHNMELKKQLSEVKALLVLEREERRQQEVEMMNKTSRDMKKIEELEVEIEKLTYNSQPEESGTAANSPVTYLTLRADEFNSDVVNASNKPETPSFCQSTNQCNANISQVLGHFVSAEGTSLIDSQLSPAIVNDLEQESLNHEETMVRTSYNAENANKLSVLTTQVQFLQKQNALEKEHANQYQIKLEVLQNQVTQQTQQLTMAFEMQSQHIYGLLVELQDKENTILQKEEEIQQCRKQISALKDKMIKEDMEQDHDKEEPTSTCIKSLDTDGCIEGTAQLTPNAESPVDDNCQQNMTEHTIQHKQSLVNEVNNGSNEGANLATELLHLQKENYLLKLKIKSITAPKPSGINTDITSASLLEEQTPTVLSGLGACTEAQQSSRDMEEHRKDCDEQPEIGSLQLDHIGYLQQQVVALQTKLQALSEENQQKTEELTLWRLASGPVCPLTDSEPVEHKQEHGPVDLQNTAPEQRACVSLLREDEILLSCSSNKLQGRTLFSRLQQNLIFDPKTLPPFLILQEHKKNHSEADKENTSPTQHNQRNDTKNICRRSGPEPCQVPDCCTVNPSNTEVKVIESINRDAEVYMKCVSTQTESLCVSPDPQFTHTRAEAEGEPPSVSPAAFYEIQQSKGVMLTAAFPIPADPARLAERIRQNRTQLSAAFDDTEYEPYGLPEVVMKGFADIPSGPSCPYIVRRGLLGTAAVPVLPKNMEDVEETD